MIDEYTRQCLAMEVARAFTARDLMLTQQFRFAVRGAPQYIRSDNGPEFIYMELQTWLPLAAVLPLCIHKKRFLGEELKGEP
jgi:putative transposase